MSEKTTSETLAEWGYEVNNEVGAFLLGLLRPQPTVELGSDHHLMLLDRGMALTDIGQRMMNAPLKPPSGRKRR